MSKDLISFDNYIDILKSLLKVEENITSLMGSHSCPFSYDKGDIYYLKAIMHSMCIASCKISKELYEYEKKNKTK